MLIGLTSRNAAGKDEVARCLVERHGFRYFSLSDVLREELVREGLPVTRENLIRKGNDLRLSQGPGVLAEKALETLREEEKAVVVSIRNPGEVEALRRRADFLLVGVDAPVELRFSRAKARGRTDDAASLEDFIRQEQAELAGDSHQQQLDRCFRMADRVLVNEGTLEELFSKVEKIL
jgi:dephospho-CoA kinase